MKVVVEEDCRITDSSDCSHYVNGMEDLYKIPNSKVCVYCDRVQVLKT